MSRAIESKAATYGWTLNDPSLLRTQAYVNGEWVNSDSGEMFAVHNPATQEIVANVASVGWSETRRAIEAAEIAQKNWAAKSAMERAVLLRKWYELIVANTEDLAIIMTVEQGKVLAESRGEIHMQLPSLNGLQKKESVFTAMFSPYRRAVCVR